MSNSTSTIEYIPVDQILPHPDNPRKNLGDLAELADSIKANGVLQNLTVVPGHYENGKHLETGYTAVIGHRRHAAAKLAGLETVPCVVVDMTQKEQVQTMLLENMQRSDLTVYEQAQGFQMMLDLGATVEEIAEKSGFSQTTVRRRVKMMELDQEKLKEVSSRQLALGDFDQLAEIEDLKLRNKVLADIGTAEFNSSLAKAKITEETARRLPEVKKWLKDHGAKKITRQESYGSKYETFYANGRYCSYIRIHLLGQSGNALPSDKDIGDTKLFYVLDDGDLSLYRERTKPQREKKSQEQKDRERAQREAKKEVKELSSLHYALRKAFIDKLTVSKKNKEAVLLGALNIALYNGHSHGSAHADAVTERLGLSNYEYNTDSILKAVCGLPEKDLAKAVYDLYGDSPENWFAYSMESPGCFPGYDKNHNTSLTLLYKWLISLGYEMSADEKALMDGTHEVYRRGKQA